MNFRFRMALWIGLTAGLATTASGAEEAFLSSSDAAALLAKTHHASSELRERTLRKAIASKTWPPGAWGDILWALSALYLDEQKDEANERLLFRTESYNDAHRKGEELSAFRPEEARETPWAYFGLTDYVRTLYLFRARSPHFPGRLNPKTEAAMMEALWHWVKTDSTVSGAALENLLVPLGTENHDLTRRPNHYLVTSLLKEDPLYRNKVLQDGHIAAEHAAAYADYFQNWPRQRAAHGLWIELGSDTYQKYSWPALFNLHELAPDPVIRHRFGLLLDLAFIEEAQISIRGRRGGGRSRAGYGKNGFESYKDLLYAPEKSPSRIHHSRVIETSRYQLPIAAIMLHHQAFSPDYPFIIRNRVLGELKATGAGYAADSALVNYAFRTPHYLLGSTLQNPSMTLPHADAGTAALKYGGMSRQNRWCGMLFDASRKQKICAVYPIIEQTRGGRPQHAYWTVQHKSVLLLQRIAPENRIRMGSYSTGKVGIRFDGEALQIIEDEGWIFASNTHAFVGVKFLDGGYSWDEKREVAWPAEFVHATDTSRILLHAGDLTSCASFDDFRKKVLGNHLVATPERVVYDFGPPADRMVAHLLDVDNLDDFTLPEINGTPVHLRPAMTWQSPFLKGTLGASKVTVTVGSHERVLDFNSTTDKLLLQVPID